MGNAVTDVKQRHMGPTTWQQWVQWQQPTPEQRAFGACMHELKPYFSSKEQPRRSINAEEVRAMQHTLRRKYKYDVDEELIQEAYRMLHKESFLQRAIESAKYCKAKFGVDS